MNRACAASASALLVLALSSCATTKGTLLQDTGAADTGQSEVRSLSSTETQVEGEQGLEIDSDPGEAEVYLDNRYLGTTPLVLDDVEPGRHKLTLRKEGYYPHSEWVDYRGEYLSYFVRLEQITGFLRVEVSPPQAEVLVGSQWVPAGSLQELPARTQRLRIRAFGYREAERVVVVRERSLTEVQVELERAPFELSNLRVNREALNPRNAGLLGTVTVRFRVSSYGRGRVEVLDPDGEAVYAQELGRFTTWEQSFQWDGRDRRGTPLPDGAYTIRLEAKGETGPGRLTAQLAVRLDSTIQLAYRSLWSGSAGTLYAPSPEVLPGGTVQFSMLSLAHIHGWGADAVLRVPLNLALRAGIGAGNRLELDTLAGTIVGYQDENFYLPWALSAMIKAEILRPVADPGLAAAVQAKLTYQNVYTDTLANFTGLSVALPAALRWGPAAVLVCPELILSPWSVSYDPGQSPQTALRGWLYGRLGLLLDLHSLSAAASVSFRSLPFNLGLGLEAPFQAALEANLLIPGTQLFLSLAVAGEFEPPGSFYFLGGAGLGLLN